MATAKQPARRAFPRHVAFYIALATGLVGFGIALLLLPKFALAIGVNLLFIVYLGLVWVTVSRLSPE